jgi:predicted transcriptional regulator
MQALYDLTVADVMHDRVWDLPLATGEMPVKMVLLILTTRGYVWVVEDNASMNLLGIITEHDVMNLLEDFEKEIRARDIACRRLIKCSREDSIADVLLKIKTHNVRRIPVLDGNRLVGEITLRHLIEKVYSLLL